MSVTATKIDTSGSTVQGSGLTGRQLHTTNDLTTLLVARSKRGAFFATIVARTVPAMNKTNNPLFGRVEKISRVNGVLRWDYESSVNRQRGREGKPEDFEVQPRKWGERVPGTCLVSHNGSLYLEMKVERSLGCEYLLDGYPVDGSIVEPYLRKSTSNQGLDREVVLRDYALSSLQSVTFDGTVYELGRELVAVAV